MPQNETVKWMAEGIAKASRSVNFSAAGTMSSVDPGLEVDGVGPVRLPLKPKVAKQLIDVCKVAPYGKGTKTLVDRKVRNSYELSPSNFRLSDDWNQSIDKATRQVANQLGLPEDRLQAKLYKLLLYERGGFFLPHRDSEKLGRMVGSLVVALPTSFSGGELVVRHESSKQTFSFSEASNEKAANFVAFYADCEHEIRKVTRGRRIALTYNLTLKKAPKSRTQSSGSSDSAIDVLVRSIGSWIAARPGKPLVFALEHQYTERGLAVDLLKGVDRSTAKLVISAAEKAGCRVHLAQVSRHLLQFADDGSFGRGRHWGYRNFDVNNLTIGEAYEDELTGDCWKNTQGKRQRFGPLPLDTTAIVSTVSLDDWKPTSEQYEGYTGNAGNTLDRWYHRSAIVIWHNSHHFDVLARCGAQRSIDLFLSMMSKLEKTPKKCLEAAQDDCLRLAKAIVHRWPQRSTHVYHSIGRDEEQWFVDFAKEILRLDAETILCDFFSALAHRDKCTGLDKVIPQACRKHGMDVFSTQLEQLISLPGKYDSAIALRDIKWLSAVCCDRKLSSQTERISRLCSVAVQRFCESYVQAGKPFHRREMPVGIKALPLLAKALVAIRADPLLAKTIDAVRSDPESFSLEKAQVPCLKTLIPWSTKHEGGSHPLLERWLAEVRDELISVTSEKPLPPTDWARPGKVECNCRFCVQLNKFLLDPAIEETRIAAREDSRVHITHNIQQYRCDASHKLEKKGSPYSLVLTKTTASHERAMKQYAMNVEVLKSLPSLD